MQRFITYLYEYNHGQKTQNTGFIRVDERQGQVRMQISIRQFIRTPDKGKICALVWKNGISGVELGDISVFQGNGDICLSFSAKNIVDCGLDLEDVLGIGIKFNSGRYLASCWKDEAMVDIARGEYQKWPPVEDTEGNNSSATAKDLLSEITSFSIKEEHKTPDSFINGNCIRTEECDLDTPRESCSHITLEKIELNEIRKLPSPNWYLCQNRFLLHGFWSYRYIVLKTVNTGEACKQFIGVPGIYEKQEMAMAALYGFPEFCPLSDAMQKAPMHTAIEGNDCNNTNVSSGDYGCYFVPLKS